MPKPPKTTEQPAPKKRKKVVPVATAPAPYEIPGLPISEGPQSSQRKLTPAKGEQPIIVVLPAGAFQYVWEMLEAKARVDHQKYTAIPPITLAAEESVRAFRVANSAALARREVRKRR